MRRKTENAYYHRGRYVRFEMNELVFYRGRRGYVVKLGHKWLGLKFFDAPPATVDPFEVQGTGQTSW